MIHYGDITKISGNDVPIVDIITGGSPCQDLSIAGKREGLSGERSGLFMEQIRIIKEMRDRCVRTNEPVRPRYMVWENVPGAFSSNKGEDFRIVLEETARVVDKAAVIPRPEGGARWTNSGCIMADGWSIAWRVHDAQFWGVPQRRRRISLVADFNGQSAPKILFERKGVCGDIAQSGEQGQRIAADVESGTDTAISFQERAGCAGGVKVSLSNPTEQAHCQQSTDNSCYPTTARSLTARYDSSPCEDRGQNIVCIQGNVIDRNANCNGKGYKEDIAFTLNATDKHGVYALDRAAYNQGANAQYNFAVDKDISQTCVAKDPGAVYDARGNVSVPIAPTMTGDHQNRITDYTAIISFYPQMKAESQCYRDDDISNTLVNGTNAGYQNGIVTSTVRRLTVTECERLQGYPDGWTDIGDWTDTKGKPHKASDSVRYKALGNSIALPFWQWLADRIVKQYYEQPTMASLFDGIGGFPLVFSRAKAFPVWASEIEEFPIAVTKIRIG